MNANEWNSKYPVGTLVKYIPPGRRDGDFIWTATTQAAVDVEDKGCAMVQIGACGHKVSVSYLIPEEEL